IPVVEGDVDIDQSSAADALDYLNKLFKTDARRESLWTPGISRIVFVVRSGDLTSAAYVGSGNGARGAISHKYLEGLGEATGSEERTASLGNVAHELSHTFGLHF